MTGLTKNEVSWRISDHYPLWAEFRLTEGLGIRIPEVRELTEFGDLFTLIRVGGRNLPSPVLKASAKRPVDLALGPA